MMVEYSAKDVIASDNERMKTCYDAIKDILKTYGCELECSAKIKPNGTIDFEIQVVVEGK